MFDISMAGPVAGAALSFSMFFVGLLLSSNPVGASDLVEVPSQLFQGSLLLGLISRATLGYRYLILDILNLVHFESLLVISFYFFPAPFPLPVTMRSSEQFKRKPVIMICYGILMLMDHHCGLYTNLDTNVTYSIATPVCIVSEHISLRTARANLNNLNSCFCFLYA
jgi:hypothetical protein